MEKQGMPSKILKASGLGLLLLMMLLFFSVKVPNRSSKQPLASSEKESALPNEPKPGKHSKIERRTAPPPVFKAIDPFAWVYDYCKRPSIEELKGLLAKGDISSAERLGVIWLEPSLIYDAVAERDLNESTMRACLMLLPADYPAVELEEMVSTFSDPSRELYAALSGRYASSGNIEKAIESLNKSRSLEERDPADLEIANSIKATLLALGRTESSANILAGVKSNTPFPEQDVYLSLFNSQVGATIDTKLSDANLGSLIHAFSDLASNEVASPPLRWHSLKKLQRIQDNIPVHLKGDSIGIRTELENAISKAKGYENQDVAFSRIVTSKGRALHEQLEKSGIDGQYYDLVLSQGRSSAFLWLQTEHPDILDQTKNLPNYSN